MSISFEADETETALVDAVTALCRQHCGEAVARDRSVFPTALWRALCAFGLFEIAAPGGSGGAVELAAVCEVLGGFAAPGPIAATVFAAQVLEGEARAKVVAGEAIAVLAAPPLVPWPNVATVVLESDRAEAWLASLESFEPVRTASGEPWGRGAVRRGAALGPAGRAAALHDLVVAAYLAGAGRRLIRDASAYVANRRQFGKTLGQFQAVSQPLASCAVRLRAASALARRAAHRLDVDADDWEALAVCARRSAEAAALQASYTCHQSYGAMGVTMDGPVYFISRVIRQLANQPLGLAAAVQAVERTYVDEPAPDLAIVER